MSRIGQDPSAFITFPCQSTVAHLMNVDSITVAGAASD
ncbi:hypothetical protein F6453_0360 [Marinobacter nauticus]|uniref:Uncharacterized protein n=1 Tax=Marinobacter nauticus TaxID=2743 RepID=A0A833JTF5_MARNT|nr:hypothetical protein F6453_0360 [Marinobacter nauticus]